MCSEWNTSYTIRKPTKPVSDRAKKNLSQHVSKPIKIKLRQLYLEEKRNYLPEKRQSKEESKHLQSVKSSAA